VWRALARDKGTPWRTYFSSLPPRIAGAAFPHSCMRRTRFCESCSYGYAISRGAPILYSFKRPFYRAMEHITRTHAFTRAFLPSRRCALSCHSVALHSNHSRPGLRLAPGPTTLHLVDAGGCAENRHTYSVNFIAAHRLNRVSPVYLPPSFTAHTGCSPLPVWLPRCMPRTHTAVHHATPLPHLPLTVRCRVVGTGRG